ncbi:MAG TPA: hypothetical protein PK503_09785 [Azonexus sp.]|nr:hypothetical protein [Azonexus sp.]
MLLDQAVDIALADTKHYGSLRPISATAKQRPAQIMVCRHGVKTYRKCHPAPGTIWRHRQAGMAVNSAVS